MKLIKNVSLCGKLVDIAVESGKIKAIGKTDGDGADFSGARMFPGVTDAHSHGRIGKNFNLIRAIARSEV